MFNPYSYFLKRVGVHDPLLVGGAECAPLPSPMIRRHSSGPLHAHWESPLSFLKQNTLIHNSSHLKYLEREFRKLFYKQIPNRESSLDFLHPMKLCLRGESTSSMQICWELCKNCFCSCCQQWMHLYVFFQLSQMNKYKCFEKWPRVHNSLWLHLLSVC